MMNAYSVLGGLIVNTGKPVGDLVYDLDNAPYASGPWPSLTLNKMN